MAVTIEDIAREAKVSIATVSRVINNSKAVSTELHQRVYDVIQKNNFKPNSLARGLVTKKSNMIGIVIPDISNPVFGALTKGINSICQHMGYTLMVCESGGIQEKELELLKILSDKMIDGVLFAGVDVNSTLIENMKDKEYPVVLVTQEAADRDGALTTVVHDNVKATYDAVTFLIVNGHKRIAFISGPEHDYSSGKKRMQGYKMALKENEIEVPKSYIEYGNFTFDSGYYCMKKIYEENSELPSAVMICSDLMAIGAMRFLKTSKLKIPDDISIMGFDDSELAMYFTPELSTVRISYFAEGEKAAKELFKLMKGQKYSPAKTYYLPHKIIRRNSVRQI